MRNRRLLAVALVGAAWLSSPARAADHTDGTPATLNQPDASSDITDVYTWMADATHLNLVMDVFPNAVVGSKFSNAVQYVFHLTSKASLLATSGINSYTAICTFDTSQKISCWVLSSTGQVLDKVTGDASATTGLSSTSGKIKVFAGLRDDPFFFNLLGFKAATKTVAGALKHGVDPTNGPITAINAAGCPTLSAGAQPLVVGQLAKNAAGTGPGVDTFAKNAGGPTTDQPFSGNVLSIVMVLDTSLVTTSSAKVVGVWGSTNKGQ